jgi:hypothetical protein
LNIVIEKGGWKVTRHIGVGDRELVRAGLLQVSLLCNEDIELQLQWALRAAVKIGKTLRVYINFKRLTEQQKHNMIFVIMGNYRDHDIMEEFDISTERFDWVLNRSDLLVEGSGNGEDLKKAIIECWQTSMGRDFLDCQCHRQELNWCKSKFPELYEREEEMFEMWST